MKRVLIRLPILVLAFLASVILFSRIFNTGETVNTTDFESPTLPILYMKTADTLINPMYGYKVKMQEDTIRDGITPMDTDRELTLVVDLLNSKVSQITYTVTTPDMETVVEEQKLSLPAESDGMYEITFSLRQPILMGQEYPVCYTLTMADGSKAYYYGRILQKAGLNTSQYLSFVTNFYEAATNKESAKALTTYLESESNGSKDLSYVDIHGTYSRITWIHLSPQIAKKAVPSIREINETTCTIDMNYVITSVNDADLNDYYYVKEYYRMRYASSRVMLLNYDRSAEQILDINQTNVTSGGLSLGITSTDNDLVSDANADVAAFVQAGELYTFHRSSCRLTKIFSFRTGDELDMRELNQDHDIKIIRVDQSGNVDFVVSGYMNTDRYEGQNGIAVYHFDAQSNITKEQMFIPCDVSGDCLDLEMTDFSYITQDNYWYTRINDTLYKIDLNDGSVEILLSDIADACFMTSSSQMTIAWTDEMSEDDSRSITMMDLETGLTHKVSCGEEDRLQILGFLNEDLVYGVAHQNDITDALFPMATVYIEDLDGNIVKEYKEDNRYVTGATVTKEYIELKRVKKNDSGKFKSTEKDRIINNTELVSEKAEYVQTTDDDYGLITSLVFTQELSEEVPFSTTSKYSTYAANEELDVTFEGIPEGYYQVYYHGRLQKITKSAKQAIRIADENLGCVLNTDQQYVWERGNKSDSYPPNVDILPEGILSIPTSVKECQELLGDDYTAIDLKGRTLDEVLYFVNKGRAVAAKTDDGYTLIVGYDYYNVLLYDPKTGETYYAGMNDSTALFEKNGNHFISYIEKFKE